MKKVMKALMVILCLTMMMPVFAEEELTNDNMYGQEVKYSTSNEYKGEIHIDGVYIAQDDNEYIITYLYSNGELLRENYESGVKVKCSFFNPPSGNIIKIFSNNEMERVNDSDHAVQFNVDKERFNQVDSITLLLYDAVNNDDKQRIVVFLELENINFETIPHINNLYAGYKPNTDELKTVMNSEPASWAKNNIEELQLEGIFREEAFQGFSEGITRERFVYLMVNLYEELTETQITIDSAINFEDSVDVYVLKAASIGITTGIGDNKFGPEIILNREQMTTFLIKTLNLANIEMTISEDPVAFADDSDISDWAKSFIYTAKKSSIMGGTGNNNFSPKGEATNEQALYITHGLLKKHGSLEWLKAFEGSRMYLKKNGELYNLSLMGDVLVSDSETDVKLYIKSIEDTQKVINALLLQTKHIAYTSSVNPNVKGNLKEYDYKKMKVTAENLYSGVDKNGEKTIINIDNGKFEAEVSQNLDGLNHTIKNFDTVKFYDLNGKRAETHLLPLDKMAEALSAEYKVTYDTIWNIYVIEVIDE